MIDDRLYAKPDNPRYLGPYLPTLRWIWADFLTHACLNDDDVTTLVIFISMMISGYVEGLEVSLGK
jgi:hypothetical protein